MRRNFFLAMGGIALTYIVLSPPAFAELVRVNMFAVSQNLAVFVAQDKEFFAKQGLDVTVQFTPNSQAQRDGIAQGKFDIAHAGVDNAVAMVDAGVADVVITAGGGNAMNELIVRPEIKSYEDLRRKTMVVDAPNTAYALLLYKMLALKGVKKGDYAVLPAGTCSKRLEAMKSNPDNAAAMLNPPCSIVAAKEGFKSFGPAVDVVGPYQADGVWMLRTWFNSHRDTVVRYLRAIIEARRWSDEPRNRTELAEIIARHLKSDPAIELKSVELAVGPNGGLSKDARFNMRGFKTTLQLRAEFAGRSTPADPAKYLDLSAYAAAIKQEN